MHLYIIDPCKNTDEKDQVSKLSVGDFLIKFKLLFFFSWKNIPVYPLPTKKQKVPLISKQYINFYFVPISELKPTLYPTLTVFLQNNTLH